MPDYIPALKAKMGDWGYYVTAMKMGKIARECQTAEEIYPDKDLYNSIQQKLKKNAEIGMVSYLLNEPQHFYNAIIVAVHGGEPEFAPIQLMEHNNQEDSSGYGFGLLRFDGNQTYYTLDGQQRLKSIKEAIILNPELASEEITVIILKHENSQEGLQRTRRLFATLNRRAKPTTASVNIAIDEDDAIAIITRRLVKENKTLKNLVLSSLGSKQLNTSKKNDSYITTLAALYETNEILLKSYQGGLEISGGFKQFRPESEVLDEYYNYLEHIWLLMLNTCPEFSAVLKGNKKPGELRYQTDEFKQIKVNENGKPIPGGNVFARPIGQFIIADVVAIAGIQGRSVKDAIAAIMENISMNIDDPPWRGIIWNSNTKTMIAGGKRNRILIVNLITNALGLKIPLKVKDLKQEYRDLLDNPHANLLPPIQWSGRTSNAED